MTSSSRTMSLWCSLPTPLPLGTAKSFAPAVFRSFTGAQSWAPCLPSNAPLTGIPISSRRIMVSSMPEDFEKVALRSLQEGAGAVGDREIKWLSYPRWFQTNQKSPLSNCSITFLSCTTTEDSLRIAIRSKFACCCLHNGVYLCDNQLKLPMAISSRSRTTHFSWV